MQTIEKFRLYEEPMISIVNCTSAWSFSSRGDYPYRGTATAANDWADVMENRESIFIKNQGTAVLTLVFTNFTEIDNELEALLDVDPDNDDRWLVTYPVQVLDADNDYRDAGTIFTHANASISGSPAIFYSSKYDVHTKIDFTFTPVLTVDGASAKTYRVKLHNEEKLSQTNTNKVKITKRDIAAADETKMLTVAVGESVSMEFSEDIVVYMKGSEAVYFLQLK